MIHRTDNDGYDGDDWGRQGTSDTTAPDWQPPCSPSHPGSPPFYKPALLIMTT